MSQILGLGLHGVLGYFNAYVPRLCPREPWLQFFSDISVWLDPADMPREVGDKISRGK